MDRDQLKRPKRSRVPISCSLCRTRKKKCDRHRPYCSNCLNLGATSQCNYEKQPWQAYTNSNVEDMQNEVKVLRERVKRLELDLSRNRGSSGYLLADLKSEETVIDYSKDKSVAYDNLSLTSMKIIMKESSPMYFGPTGYMTLIINDQHANGIFEEYLRMEKKKYQEGNLADNDQDFDKYSFQKLTKGLYIKLLNLLLEKLPSTQIINALCERFFQFCYQFIPIIDKEIFMRELEEVLVTEGNKISNFRIDNFSLMALICQLLIILRFAYITLPMREYLSSDSKKREDTLVTMIKENDIVIPIHFIDDAQCLLCFPWRRKIEIRYLQAILLLYSYKLNCPEGDPESYESTLLLSSSIFIARSCGLGIDPCKVKADFLNIPLQHIWRKIWAQLLYMDASYAFSYGRPLMISDTDFDSEWPFNTSDKKELAISDEEINIMRHFKVRAEATILIRRALSIFDDKKRPIRLLDIHGVIKSIKHVLFSKLRAFDQLYNSEFVFAASPSNDRAQEFLLRVALTYQLYILNYVAYTHGRNQPESRHLTEYLYLTLESGIILLRIAHVFSKDPSKLFGSELESFVAPSIFSYVMKIVPTLVSILISAYQGNISLLESVKHFSSPDSIGLVKWTGINTGDELISIKRMTEILHKLNSNSLHMSVKFYSCHKLRCTLAITLKYLKSNFPILLENSDTTIFEGQETLHGYEQSQPDSDKYEKDFLVAENFWQNIMATPLGMDLEMNSFEASDPFLNDVQSNFNSIFNLEEFNDI